MNKKLFYTISQIGTLRQMKKLSSFYCNIKIKKININIIV